MIAVMRVMGICGRIDGSNARVMGLMGLVGVM